MFGSPSASIVFPHATTLQDAQHAGLPAGDEPLAAVRQFVARVGGLDNARRALDVLAMLNFAGCPPTNEAL